jgi:hypothetical protein
MRRLFVSFSGGETSALMTHLLLTKWRGRWDDVRVVFANTGQENEETLQFVAACDKHFGFGTVWVEADVCQEARVGTRHRVVDFSTANRDGGPFEAMIRKYGIPNQKFPHCTRELKLNPMRSYIQSLGWRPGTYDTAIGIRADEPGRRSKNQEAARLLYPLLDWRPTTKPQVNAFWIDQPFRLNLCGYQGNCRTCWKKSARKLLTIMDDRPRAFDFFERMEDQYGTVGPEFSKERAPGYVRTFFRGNQSVKDLRQAHSLGGFERAEDDSIILPDGKRINLDFEQGAIDGCSESCEVDFRGE